MDLNSRQYVVSLDMTRTGSIRESFEMRHNDDNELIIELRDSAGIIDLNVSGVINATLLVTRKDKVDIPLAGTITPEGRASFKLKRASLEKQGMVEVVAQFYFANDVRISTPTLIFNVLRDPSAGAVGDEGDDRTLIEIILNDAPALLEQLQTAYDELVIQKAAFAQFQSDSETAFSNAQNQRLTDFNADQAARSTAFEDAQTQRATDFNTSQGERTTLFNQAQTDRQTDYTTWKDAKDTELNQLASDTENSKLAADGASTNANNAATAANAAATNANNKVTELNGYNTRLQGVETETANARQSTVKGKTFASVDARFEELEGETYKPITNLITNGNFANGTTGWSTNANVSLSTEGGKLASTATSVTSSNGIVQTVRPFVVGHKFYISFLMTAYRTHEPRIYLGDSARTIPTQAVVGKETHISTVETSTSGTGSFIIYDNGVLTTDMSVGSKVLYDNIIIINLTQAFGAGKEPSKEDMDRLLNVHYSGWFDGTVNVAKKLLERSAQQLADTFVPMKNEVSNGDFSNGTAGWGENEGINTIANVNNVLVSTISTVNSSSYVRVNPSINFAKGTKVYVSYLFKPFRTHVPVIRLAPQNYVLSDNLVTGNVTNKVSSVLNVLEDSTSFVFYDNGASSTDMTVGSKVEYDNIVVINLTQVFGKGNEPTKEEMDRLLAKYQNSFFDGTVNLTPRLLDDLRYLTSDVQMPMKNDVVNGDFALGSSGWVISTGVASVTYNNGEATVQTTSENAYGLYQNTGGKTGIRYFSAEFFSVDGITQVNLGNGIISTNIPANTWGRVSNVVASADLLRFYGGAKASLTYKMRRPLVINLTEVFGAGNEPTQAQMDALLATYPNIWFDGTVNLAENKRIIPFLLKRLELKADKAQEAWIKPTLINGWTEYNPTSTPLGYKKSSTGVVTFRGRISVGTASSSFTLPQGYRTGNVHNFVVAADNGNVVILEISNSGAVIVLGWSGRAWVSLDGVSFRVD